MRNEVAVLPLMEKEVAADQNGSSDREGTAASPKTHIVSLGLIVETWKACQVVGLFLKRRRYVSILFIVWTLCFKSDSPRPRIV